MSRRGAMVALSGVDCAGKSTQRDLLVCALRAWGHDPLTIWSRAGYTGGLETLKWMLRAATGRRKAERQGVSGRPGRYPRRAADLGSSWKRRLWLTAALLDLAWLYVVRVRVLRVLGRTVVCDRYLLDQLVDFRVNFPDDRVEERWLCRWLARASVRPDAAFCLVVPPELSLERARGKARFHWEIPEVLERRWREYGALSAELGVQVLDGERPADELARAIQRGVAGVLQTVQPHPGRPN